MYFGEARNCTQSGKRNELEEEEEGKGGWANRAGETHAGRKVRAGTDKH